MNFKKIFVIPILSLAFTGVTSVNSFATEEIVQDQAQSEDFEVSEENLINEELSNEIVENKVLEEKDFSNEENLEDKGQFVNNGGPIIEPPLAVTPDQNDNFPYPSISKIYTFEANSLCSTQYYKNNILVIDLSKLPKSYEAIEILQSSVNDCRFEVKEVSIVNPTNTLNTVIFGEWAFAQVVFGVNNTGLEKLTFSENIQNIKFKNASFYQSSSNGKTTLKEIIFPKNMKNLDISEQIFHQDSWKLGNSLQNIVFPEKIDNFILGAGSFEQFCGGCNNSLESVVFPKNENIKIGNRAFLQEVYFSGNNAMKNFVISSNTKSIEFGEQSFSQVAEGVANNSLKNVIFPGTLNKITIDTLAFSQSAKDGKNTLETVEFEEGIQNINIWEHAFSQSIFLAKGTSSLKTIIFNNGITELTIFNGAFQTYGSTPKVNIEFRTFVAPGLGENSLKFYDEITSPNVEFAWYGNPSTIKKAWGEKVSTTNKYDYSLKTIEDFSNRTKNINRFSGSNRYQTSIELNKKNIRKNKPLFIATGENFPDALTISPVAVKQKGSVLLTSQKSLPKGITELIKEMNPSKIYIIGGENTINKNVENQIKNIFNNKISTKRIFGKDRYETNYKILKEFYSSEDLMSMVNAYIVSGDNFPDALSVSSIAGFYKAPLVLINPKTKNLTPDTIKTMKNLGVVEIMTVGGENSIDKTAFENLNKLFSTNKRVSGKDRYETNAKINAALDSSRNNVVAKDLWISSGDSYSDSLSASVFAGDIYQRLILSKNDCIPKGSLPKDQSFITDINLIGGFNTLSDNVKNLKVCS